MGLVKHFLVGIPNFMIFKTKKWLFFGYNAKEYLTQMRGVLPLMGSGSHAIAVLTSVMFELLRVRA